MQKSKFFALNFENSRFYKHLHTEVECGVKTGKWASIVARDEARWLSDRFSLPLRNLYIFLKKMYTLLYKEFKLGGDCKWKTDDMFVILEQITLKGVYFSFHKYLFVCFPNHYPRYLTQSG